MSRRHSFLPMTAPNLIAAILGMGQRHFTLPRRRQWVMIPNSDTVWSHDCLDAVRQELVRRNNGERRAE